MTSKPFGSIVLIMTGTLTRNEIAVLNAVARNECNECNYGVPENAHQTGTWIATLNDGLYREIEGYPMPKGKALSGTCASLMKKDFYWCDYDKRDGNTCGLTDEGFEAWKNHPAVIPTLK